MLKWATDTITLLQDIILNTGNIASANCSMPHTPYIQLKSPLNSQYCHNYRTHIVVGSRIADEG